MTTGVEMDIELDPMSPVPIYQQIRDRIVEGIAYGELTTGTTLASVRALSSAFGVNPATVVKAYDLLRRDGFVHTNRRSGSVIARDVTSPPREDVIEDWRARLLPVLAEARANGMSPSRIVAECDSVAQGFVADGVQMQGES